jgi:hypothetical protein
MSKKYAQHGSRLCVAAATAVGIFTLPNPMLPIAHAACEDWVLGPTVWEVALDNGILVETYGWSGKAMTTTPGGKAAFSEYFPPGGGAKTEGPSSGNINGRAINFSANWATGPGAGGSNTFTGNIGDDGTATGSTRNAQGVTNNWTSTDKVKCNTAAAGAGNGGAPAGTGTTPAKQTVTVQQESTVYDSVGGNPIKDADGVDFFIKPGDPNYETVQPCANNWCLLKIPKLPAGSHGNLPAGQGWVYSGIDTGENFLKVNG